MRDQPVEISVGIGRRAAAEAVGTLWLVLGGVGTAVLAGGTVGPLGISLAFGLSVLTMAYALGAVSGAHLNPAISLGLYSAGRLSARDLGVYVCAQIVGGIAGAVLVWAIAEGGPGGYDPQAGGLGANGFGAHSPGGYDAGTAFLVETALTFFFVVIALGVTSRRAPHGFGGLAIGLALAVVHLVGIPVTNLSVNPARSTGPALIVGGWAMQQLWLFWAAPLLGGLLGGLAARALEPAAGRELGEPHRAPPAPEVPSPA